MARRHGIRFRIQSEYDVGDLVEARFPDPSGNGSQKIVGTVVGFTQTGRVRIRSKEIPEEFNRRERKQKVLTHHFAQNYVNLLKRRRRD